MLHWWVLSVLFFGLSIDAGAAIHERAGARFHEFAGLGIPVLQEHRWLVAGVVFTLVVGLFFVPFMARLGGRTRALFALSGVVLLSGALGFEFAGATMLTDGDYARDELPFRLRLVLEEGCEMFGVAIFNRTLMGLLHKRRAALQTSVVD